MLVRIRQIIALPLDLPPSPKGEGLKGWRDYWKVRLTPGSFGYAQDDLRVGRWSRAEGGELLKCAALVRSDVSTALRFAQHDEWGIGSVREGGELLKCAVLARPDVSTALRFAQHDE